MFIAKLIKDKDKINNKVLPMITKNFIVANFLKENKRTKKVYLLINSDGITTNYKNGLYTIDKNAVWYDENNYPNLYYFEGIPNPLILLSEKNIKKFISAVNNGSPNTALDDDGNLIDISFSSQNLQLFKQNKIFEELNKNPEATKTQLALFGIITALIIALILSIVIK